MMTTQDENVVEGEVEVSKRKAEEIVDYPMTDAEPEDAPPTEKME